MVDIGKIIGGIFAAIFSVIEKIFSLIFSAVMAIFDPIFRAVSYVLTIILQAIVRVVRAIKNVIVFLLSNIVGIIVSAIMWVVNATLSFIRLVFETFGKTLGGLVTSVSKKSGTFAPVSLRNRLDKMVIYSGTEKTTDEILGTTLLASLGFAALLFGVMYFFKPEQLYMIAAPIGGFLVVWILMLAIMSTLVESRVNSVDAVLPDILQIVSQNLLSGMTPYNALWLAARPEFGPLAFEIQRASKETLAGKPLEDALNDLKERVPSSDLQRTIRLMIQGMKSGGELPVVLQGISEDIREMHNLQKEMKANTTAYTMFILFALLIGAPLLFSVSIVFIEIFSSIFERLPMAAMEEISSQGGMVSLSPLAITPDFFLMYAMLVLFFSAFLGSFIISVIQTGKETAGLKLMPVLIILAVGIFFVLHFVLAGFFGGMMN